MTYTVKNVFRTIQGEGHRAGTPAVFVRLAGCNMWSGREVDRVRDAQRNGAECPRWCDTDFVGGSKMTAGQVADWVKGQRFGHPLIVISGGEPLLQVDDELLDALYDLEGNPQLAIETNGTVLPKFEPVSWLPHWDDAPESDVVWLTMSPKVPRSRIVLKPEWVAELKLVWPAYDPEEWMDWPGLKYLQPQAERAFRSFQTERNLADALITGGFPGWRLSIQQHKVVEIP